jgi:hypothetical protein
LNRKGDEVATVRAHFGNSRVFVNVFCRKDGFQYGAASGYGYDKLTAALSGLTIDGHKLTDHCGDRLPLPRGKPCFPSDYKPRKGYSLANYGTWSKSTGQRLDSYHWRDMAEAASRGELVSGYSDCYREAGLKYLEAIGYRVLQAI